VGFVFSVTRMISRQIYVLVIAVPCGALRSGENRVPQRYANLRSEAPGISEMLTQTPRSLERDGRVSRKEYGTVPPKVEYALTELGRSLIFR
jgi:DNA-binding HxlR family transcriptional regulator